MIRVPRCAPLSLLAVLVAVVTGCGASTPEPASPDPAPSPSASSSSSASPAPSASSSSPTTPLPVTGGAVFIGEINSSKTFDPRPTLEGFSSQLVDCYNHARATHPDLRGKVTLHVTVNEAGAVLSVDAAPGGHANDATLVACINDAMKVGAHFPKPGGMAVVNTPLVFRP
jgi:hypothetical protein